MRKIGSLFLVLLLGASALLAHGGGSHKLLGTVKDVHEQHLVVTTKDGKEVTLQLTAKTKYERAGKAATKDELVAGDRVAVQLEEDDKTAATIKIGASKSK